MCRTYLHSVPHGSEHPQLLLPGQQLRITAGAALENGAPQAADGRGHGVRRVGLEGRDLKYSFSINNNDSRS